MKITWGKSIKDKGLNFFDGELLPEGFNTILSHVFQGCR